MIVTCIGLFGLAFYLGYTYVVLDVTEKASLYNFLATRFPFDATFLLNGPLVIMLSLIGALFAFISHKQHQKAVGGPL